MQTTIQSPSTEAEFNLLGNSFQLDELHDIATHGMSAGFCGFIYSSELHDLYEAHEDLILNYLDDKAEELYGQESCMPLLVEAITNGDSKETWTLQQLKEQAVWTYCELKAYDLLIEARHPQWV